MMREYLSNPWLVVGAVFGAVIFGLIATAVVVSSGGGSGPREVFEAHVAAVERGDSALAATFLASDCAGLLDEDTLARHAGEPLSAKYPVVDELVNDAGTLAMLRVGDVFQYLAKEDGQWRLKCTPPWPSSRGGL